MKYVYSKNTLKLLGTIMDIFTDEDIHNAYEEDIYILNKEFKNLKVVNGEFKEKTEEELEEEKYTQYSNGNYILGVNEIIRDNKIITYQPNEYERIENGVVIYDIEAKKEQLKKIANKLKQDKLEYGFIFKDNLRQPCREQDKTSVTAVIVQLQAFKGKGTDWKFFDKDTGRHIYTSLTTEELAKLGLNMSTITIKCMKAESEIIDMVDALTTEDDVKSFNVEEKFKEIIERGG